MSVQKVVGQTLFQTDALPAAVASMGVAFGETIEQKGVKLEWPTSWALRKRQWLVTCARFEAAFNDKSGWTHLEKWPR